MIRWNYLVEAILVLVMFGVASDLSSSGFYVRILSRKEKDSDSYSYSAFLEKLLLWVTILGPSFIIALIPNPVSLILGVALICICVGIWIGRRRLP